MVEAGITCDGVTRTKTLSFPDPPRTQEKAYDQGATIFLSLRRFFGGRAFSLFFFFLTFYYFTNAGWYKGGDESLMAHLARSIAWTGKVGFKSSASIGQEHLRDVTRGQDGLFYCKWGLGQSLVQVPFILLHRFLVGNAGRGGGSRENLPLEYYASEFPFLMLCPSTISALGCLIFLLFSLRLGFTQRASMVLTLAYGLATMAWPYSKSLMSEATINVAILGCVYGAVSYVLTCRRAWMAVAGISMGFAFITKPVACVIIPVLVMYVVGSAPSKRTIFDLGLAFGIPLAAFLSIQLWYNFIRYGTVLQFGYNTGPDSLGFGTPLYVGLWGLFASPGKSFFLYTPLSILGLASIGRFLKRHRAEALLFMAVWIVYIVPHALWWGWAGDWAWGPRFLLVITPYIILPIGMFFETWAERSRVTKALAGILILFSFLMQFLGVSIHPYSYILARSDVIERFVDLDTSTYTYAWTYKESTFSNFSPMFSHIVGNWWLFKHMIFSYDLWSDVPWRSLGDFHLNQPLWVKDGRTIPFWWPVSLPLLARGSARWVFPLAVANLLMVVWCGLRLLRAIRRR
jgi:hypothetical protein